MQRMAAGFGVFATGDKAKRDAESRAKVHDAMLAQELSTVRNEFMRGICDATGMSRFEADAQWAGHSRQMSDSARAAVERGGYAEGVEVGAEILICQ